MKFNKIITVLLLSGLCIGAGQQVITAHAETANTVISNQETQENDTVADNVDENSEYARTIGFDDSIPEAEATVSKDVVVATSSSVNTVSDAGVNVVSGDSVDVDTVEDADTSVVSDAGISIAAVETITTKETTSSVQKVSTTVKSSTTKKTTTKKKYTNAQLRLMSSIIYCEAGGEPYAGKLAVGIVIMNRKSSKSFPNTLKGVIYQKYQFGPVRNGSLSRALKEYDAGRFTSSSEKACIKAAKAALNGTKKVTYKSKTYNMKTFYYFSTSVKGKRLTIKNHQFK